ncbi:hypothetical protein BV22DRAFT_1011487, partial [Leucogyrophana mollusca]
CFQCLKLVDLKKARSHVGEHILRFMRGISEELSGDPVSPEPCGFCGRSGISSCNEVFLTSGSSPQAQTNCAYASKFHYAPSLKSTSTSPCTNVPIRCQIPGCSALVDKRHTAIWKYNMPAHILAAHKDYSPDGILPGMPIPSEMTTSMLITSEEEQWLRIPKENIPPKVTPPVSLASEPTSASVTRAKRLRVDSRTVPKPPSKRSKK